MLRSQIPAAKSQSYIDKITWEDMVSRLMAESSRENEPDPAFSRVVLAYSYLHLSPVQIHVQMLTSHAQIHQ